MSDKKFHKRKLKSKKLDVIKKMPPLYHKLPDEEFDVFKSKAIEWLIEQPEVLQYLWDDVARRSEHIIYDPKTGKWQGIDYDGEDY